MFSRRRAFAIVPLFFATGCITRIVTVKSNPAGALVYLNDQEVGRTPVSREFQWYGNYNVVLRKEGYQTLKTQAEVGAPLWQWIPLDLITDLLPVTDEHVISFDLKVQSPENPATVLSNGEEMRRLLESSEHTKEKSKTTAPSTTRAKSSTTKSAK